MNQNATRTNEKTFLEMAKAATSVGLSLRHFRRIIGDAGIRRIKIGRRFFVIGEDLKRWKTDRATSLSEVTSRGNRDKDIAKSATSVSAD